MLFALGFAVVIGSVLGGYLPRSVVEYVPPVQQAAATPAVAPAQDDAGKSKGIGGRIRGIVPRILR